MTQTSRFRDFGSAQIFDAPEYEPVTFGLDGQTFTCRSVLSGVAMLEFIEGADSGEGGLAAGSVLKFYRAVMEPQEYERFYQFVNRAERVTPIETLAEISAWLVEVYSDRPTRLPSDSPDGTSTTALTSEVPVSSVASTQTA